MTSPGRVLLHSEFYTVDTVAEGKVIRVTRSSRPFTSEDELNDACWPVQHALDDYGRAQHGILIDTRQPQGRNDAAFEVWFAHHRRTMLIGFPRAAIVCSTTIGMMHARRLSAIDGHDHVHTFIDEDEAIAYLIGA